MRFANRALAAGALGFATAILAGCGSSGSLLSAGQASSLKGQLAQASQALAAGQCDRAQSAIQTFQNSVANLNGVDGTLVSNLNQGASTIAQLAARRCPTRQRTTTTRTTQTQTTTTQTQTQTTTTPTQTQTTTTPTQTQTTTTPTQTQTTTTTTTTTPGSGGAGLSGSAGGTAHDQQGSSGSGGGISQ